MEQRLVKLFLAGQERYQAGQWTGAIAQLRTVFDQRPDYLRGTVADMLYDAYIQTGDLYRDEEDCGLAYQRYGQAAALPVSDTAVAEARQEAVAFCVPPTDTPTVTPTPTLTPVPPSPTPWPTWTPIPPTAVPTPTPTPYDLAMLRNRIVFVLDREGDEELWAMDPDGGNRTYLGPFGQYSQQYNAIREAERFSPDGNYRLFVKAAGSTPQIFMYQPPHPEYGPLPDQQITFSTGWSYDPVWSPDGGRVAYVGTENGSDDIWLVQPDGKGARWLVRNDWEWDKHPSWSPDSSRIVFWSNREGRNQIYVMDADGRNVRNISNTDWDEYDPLWIK
jgi:TolB protein